MLSEETNLDTVNCLLMQFFSRLSTLKLRGYFPANLVIKLDGRTQSALMVCVGTGNYLCSIM